jgi:type IV pilus assembly protein PilY1
MKKISLLFLLLLLIFSLASKVYAMDTDLYVASAVDIPPNVLIILDNSGSMNNEIAGAVYDPNFEYPHVIVDYPNASYYKTKQRWNIWKNPYTDISCDAVKTALASQGSYRGKVVLGTSACGGSNEEIATGNYLNYLNSTGGPGNQPRFGLAKGIIHSYINTTDNVRFGLMIFNYQDGGKILYPVSDTWLPEHKTGIYNALAGLKADTWTPLSETLYEAGLYFQGKDSFFNAGVKYTTPVQYYCQKNYVILITDGEPTKDVADLPDNTAQNPIKFNIGDYDNDGNEISKVYEMQGSDYLDDVAKYLNGIDLSPQVTNKQHKQNITTYTVGFTWNSPLLQDTATNGGGKYFYAHNAQSFVIALQNIIAEILAKSTSYVAPVVPISQMESTSAGNRMYLAMFKPTFKSFWKGNIKKFGIATENSGDIKVGDVLDVSGSPAMEPVKDSSDKVIGIKIKDEATSYWSSGPDGEDVEKGGVGEKLLKRMGSRNIYTYLGTNTNLTDPSNAFQLSNSAVTPQKLGLANNDDAGRDKVINFIHGLDAYDVNGNGITNEKRDWVLGAFIHSRPIVIHYESQSVIYAGANDGMLHAFDDATGEELWGFIPPNLLSRLKNLNGETLEFFVDGAPKVYIEKDGTGKLVKVILIFGQRRGGNCYTALDITNPITPKYLWEISPSTTGYGELGQTWSTPLIGKTIYGWVAFIGGGYDKNQDNDPVTADDTKGRAIYVVDVLTGNLIWSYSRAKNADMKYCIPSDIARVATEPNGKIDRLYVGDTGGRIWRFDIGDPDTANWTGKMIFNANTGSSDHRKIFYPPDVTLENDSGNYEMLFFGTGDREHPKQSVTWNRLYAVKDKNLSTVLGENDLEDVTADLLQDPNTPQSQKTSILNALSTKYGWYIKLNENIGEKSLSNSVVFYGVVYYTTFTPSIENQADICFVGEGISRLYALNYKTGNAVFNLDSSLDGVISRTDRSAIIGTAIPSGVIITFIGGTATAYIGVGGGVYIPPLPSTKSLIPINWRIVF